MIQEAILSLPAGAPIRDSPGYFFNTPYSVVFKNDYSLVQTGFLTAGPHPAYRVPVCYFVAAISRT